MTSVKKNKQKPRRPKKSTGQKVIPIPYPDSLINKKTAEINAMLGNAVFLKQR